MDAICYGFTPVSVQISEGLVSTYLGRIATSGAAYNPPNLAPTVKFLNDAMQWNTARLIALCTLCASASKSPLYSHSPAQFTGASVQREEANVAVDAAVVSLFLPQADGLALSAEPVGTDALGHTTWIVGPGVVSGTLTPPPLTPFPTGEPLLHSFSCPMRAR